MPTPLSYSVDKCITSFRSWPPKRRKCFFSASVVCNLSAQLVPAYNTYTIQIFHTKVNIISATKSATGISPGVTELDVLIEEAIEKEELSEEIRATESKIILISKIAQASIIAIRGAHKYYKLSNMRNVLL